MTHLHSHKQHDKQEMKLWMKDIPQLNSNKNKNKFKI